MTPAYTARALRTPSYRFETGHQSAWNSPDYTSLASHVLNFCTEWIGVLCAPTTSHPLSLPVKSLGDVIL